MCDLPYGLSTCVLLALRNNVQMLGCTTCSFSDYVNLGSFSALQVAVERLDVKCRLDNKAGSGIHIGTSGVEFDERVVALGRNAEARFGATVGFPRQIPVMEGEQLLNWDIHRLGLKTRW